MRWAISGFCCRGGGCSFLKKPFCSAMDGFWCRGIIRLCEHQGVVLSVIAYAACALSLAYPSSLLKSPWSNSGRARCCLLFLPALIFLHEARSALQER